MLPDKKYSKSLFVFRRDLRFYDNKGLINALKESEKVLLAFIFDPRQVKQNQYFSENAFQFMINSLKDLKSQVRENGGELKFFYGFPEEVISKLVSEQGIQALYMNKDYTPFSIRRDKEIEENLEYLGVDFNFYDDLMLNSPGSVVKNDGGIYTKFTPYYRKALKNFVESPKELPHDFDIIETAIEDEIENLDNIFKVADNTSIKVKGGRKEGLDIIQNLDSVDYSFNDIPGNDDTSHLSAHLKFGTLSVREVFARALEVFGRNSSFISQLYWRDFHMQITYCYDHVIGGSFYRIFDGIEWENDTEMFEKWKRGETGFPIVDAGMRELNTTGWMHNRVRMIVASFLVKDLLIDWRWGERYFAQMLVDYDPALNNGNWQWAASTGCDSQPYFRIFNPWRQQERFDLDAVYIKRWVPELEGYSPKKLHDKDFIASIEGYPSPIVSHEYRKEKAKQMYVDAKDRGNQ